MAKRTFNHGETPPAQTNAYEVGHGRPPVATRFKLGQSGNPKGRPREAKNLSTLTREKLLAKVPVREGGRERRMSKAEIGVTKMVNRFVETGDPKLYILLKQLESGSGGNQAMGISATTTEEQESHADILAWYLDQNRISEGDGGGQ
jgi:hypothetical protein